MSNTYAVHIGIKAESADAIREFAGRPVILDGDGWNCWGNRPSTDVNDADTLHALIGPFETERGATLQARKIAEQQGHLLVPMGGYPFQTGIVVSVTDWDDWSENEYLTLWGAQA